MKINWNRPKYKRPIEAVLQARFNKAVVLASYTYNDKIFSAKTDLEADNYCIDRDIFASMIKEAHHLLRVGKHNKAYIKYVEAINLMTR